MIKDFKPTHFIEQFGSKNFPLDFCNTRPRELKLLEMALHNTMLSNLTTRAIFKIQWKENNSITPEEVNNRLK